MTENIGFKRPQSLNIGEIYLFREHNYIGERQSSISVTFVDYTPCPAIVIIKISSGSKRRCLREDLYILDVIEKSRAAEIEFISLIQRYSGLIKTHLTSIYQNIRIILLNPAS